MAVYPDLRTKYQNVYSSASKQRVLLFLEKAFASPGLEFGVNRSLN